MSTVNYPFDGGNSHSPVPPIGGAGAYDHHVPNPPPLDNLVSALSSEAPLHPPINHQAPISSSLGQQVLLDDSGNLVSFTGASSSHGGARNTVQSNSRTASAPSPTLVGAAGGLQIDLIWDSSVASAPSGFESAIIAAAQTYTSLFSNHEVINIQVGYGEIAGQKLGSGALGESESYGYLTNEATVVNALESHGSTPSTAAASSLTAAQFFLTSAETKTLGLISGSSTAIDGFIGLSSTYPMNYSSAGPASGSNQFDAIAIAQHEISEVMGRIGMEGAVLQTKPTYTPLDLFNYKSPGTLELSPKGGYFSVNNGTTSLGIYNNASVNGGDIADWASNTAPTGTTYDAYNAFTWPGYDGVVSKADVQEVAALGYGLTTAGVAAA